MIDPQKQSASPSLACFSDSAILWHRCTVIGTEFVVLGFAVWAFTKTWPTTTQSELLSTKEKILLTTALVALDPNLLILDHVHFQYNGYLLGLLILTFAALRAKFNILGAILFAVLLASKHIFLYTAPLFFVYLLRHHCASKQHRFNPFTSTVISHAALLGFVVIGVFIVSFISVTPGIPKSTDELIKETIPAAKQIASRLFPVSERGLLHAYWAPNFWALYAGMDKLAKVFFEKVMKWDLSQKHNLVTTNRTILVLSTQGLVQGEISFDVLPQISPLICMICTLFGIAPSLKRVWKCRHPEILLHAYACCAMASVFFGYHVHEKALVTISLPFAFCALDSVFDAKVYLMLTWTTQVALAPLLFPAELSLFKFLLLTTHAAGSFYLLDAFHSRARKARRIQNYGLGAAFSFGDRICVFGLVVVFAFYEYGGFVFVRVFPESNPLKHLFSRLPFLPLMLVSMGCAVSVAKIWWDLHGLLVRKQKACEAYSASPSFGPANSRKNR